MQYTGLSDVTGEEPPTYACVGTNDGIASYRSMEDYIHRIQENGTDAEIEVFDGLRHGFGREKEPSQKAGLTMQSASGSGIWITE